MLTIEQTVRRDWINLCESIRSLYQLRKKQVAESLGLESMTLDQFRESHQGQAIPTESDMVHLLTDLDSKVQPVNIDSLHEVLKNYHKDDSKELIKRLASIYETAPHLFESEFQGVISAVRIEMLKGLNQYLKRAHSHLKQIQNLRNGTGPLLKQVSVPLEASISALNDSIRYATAMRDFLKTLPNPPGMTSKGTRRKHQTSHSEWNPAILEAVNFLFRSETGIKTACSDAARLLQALFPNAWSGTLETLSENIYQRYLRLTNPI